MTAAPSGVETEVESVMGSRRGWRAEPRWAVAALVALTSVVVLWLFLALWLRHRAWFSQNYDIAIFNQALWLLSHGHEPYITSRIVHLFGDHASYILLALAPLYRVWPFSGPSFLYLASALAVGACLPPIYRLARHFGAPPLVGLAAAAAFGINPLVTNTANDFHPETLALPFLLWAVVAAFEDRWLLFGVMVGIAMLAKEDISVVVGFLGLWLLVVRGRRVPALITIGAALVVFAVESRVLIPRAAGGEGYLYYQRLSEYGRGLFGVAFGIVTHPVQLARDVVGPDGLRYLGMLLASLGPLVLLAPSLLIGAFPTLFVNLLSNFDAQRSIENHYVAPALPFLFAALAVGLGRVAADVAKPITRRVTALLVGAALIPSLGMHFMFSETQPASPRFEPVVFRTAHTERLEEAKRLIPPDASVSASFHLTPHVSDRKDMYLFPMPFEYPDYQSPYFVTIDGVRRVSQLDYVFVDRNVVYYAEHRLIGLFPLPAGETWDTISRFWAGWDILYDEDGILVARRPGAP